MYRQFNQRTGGTIKTKRRKEDKSAKNVKHTASNSSDNVDTLELQDENLDFEPDDEFLNEPLEQMENHFIDRSSNTINSSATNNLEQFTSVLQRGISNTFNDTRTVSLTTVDSSAKEELDTLPSISHKRYMLPFYKQFDMAEDGRQNEYLQYIAGGDGPALLDSSSSSSISGGNNQVDMDKNDGNAHYSLAECDMSSDEENRLLASDDEIENLIEEESQNIDDVDLQENPYSSILEEESIDQQPLFQDKKLFKSGLNNIIITIKSDNTCSEQNAKGVVKNNSEHCVKKEKNVLRRKLVIKKKKTLSVRNTKKWIRYEPYSEVTLFLEDIGYTPPLHTKSQCVNISGKDKSKKSSPVECIPKTSFQITFNSLESDKRDCKQVSQVSPFKTPLLPPIKRPPTRPKRSDSFSSSESMETKNYLEIHRTIYKEDDVISISASSLGQLENEYQEVKDEIQSQNENSEVNSVSYLDSSPNRAYVENWVTQVKIPSLLEQTFEPPPIIEHGSNIQMFGSVNSKGGTRLKFTDIPKFFNGLCYHYFFNEHCVRTSCKHPHLINEQVFTKKCKEMLTSEELIKLYNYTIRFHVLFQQMYPILLKGFGYFKMEKNLLTSIDDFFVLKDKININKAVECILNALQDAGLTLSESIESISFNVGFLQHPTLATILLDILTKKSDISDSWELIKRICRVTKTIPPPYFERILSKVLFSTPINRELCIDIYNVIIKSEMTNLSQVEAQLLTPIRTLAEFGGDKNSNDKNLLKEKEVFKAACQKITIEKSDPSLNDEYKLDSDDRLTYFFSTSSPTTKNRDKVNDSSGDISSHSPFGSSKSCNSRVNSENDSSSDSSLAFTPSLRSYNYRPQAVSHEARQDVTPSLTVTVANNPHPVESNSTQVPLTVSNKIVRHDIFNKVSTPPVEINLCPERPIFGKFKFKEGFSFDKSLHLLLSSSRDQVAMNEMDIIRLNNFITNSNGNDFLNLLEQYKEPSTLQHFITMCIAELKNCREPYNTFVDLLENIESIQPYFKHNSLLKGVFEVIAFNLLLVFERKCFWQDSRKLIESICDWDSLISSKQFALRKLTPMGRYILLAKLLTKSNSFYYAYEILQSTDLNLLSSPNNWPLFCVSTQDLESRNLVLTDFFKIAYRSNVEVVCDMYRKIFQFEDIYQFDAHTYFNPMLENLINSEKTMSLKHFSREISIFYKHMDHNILRAFIVFMESHLSFENKLKMYELGCEKGIYLQFTGQESSIVVKTNMPDNELKLILYYYFNKLSLQYEVNNHLIIEIKLPSALVQSPEILRKCLRSVQEVNFSVRKILFESFRLQVDSCHENSTVIKISSEALNNIKF